LDRRKIKPTTIRQQQVQEPLFEFSGACSGCGETPYLKLLSQLFGDRALIANATGCSSIYGGNLPTTPWAKNAEGRGPAWANSLFEDNAEFGLGFRLSIDKQTEFARELVLSLGSQIGDELAAAILSAPQKDEADIYEQRQRVSLLKERLQGNPSAEAKQLLNLADLLVKKSVWIVGGDGWAYDIGYGGLDHVIASGKNVNRRPSVQIHSSRSGCEIRCGRQTWAEEGSGPDRHELWQSLRGVGRDGSKGRAHPKGVPRSGSLRWAQHHHCVLPLHCARNRHDHWNVEPESSG
jgi:hypothetical protein